MIRVIVFRLVLLDIENTLYHVIFLYIYIYIHIYMFMFTSMEVYFSEFVITAEYFGS